MGELWNKFVGKTVSEASEEGDAPFFSEVLMEANLYLTPEALSSLMIHARKLKASKNPSDFEIEWIADYELHIGLALSKNNELNEMVSQRNQNKPSTSDIHNSKFL